MQLFRLQANLKKCKGQERLVCKWDLLADEGPLWDVLQSPDAPAFLIGPEELQLGPGRGTKTLSLGFYFSL